VIKQFYIKKTCSEENRPGYSYLVDEYLEEFINDNILVPYKIINGSKWNIWLIMMFFKKGNFGPTGVYVFKKPTTVSDGKVKFHPVQIPLEEVFRTDNVIKNVVELYFEAFRQFFTLNYKKISSEIFLDLKKKIDWTYLNSLPYPADIREQGFIEDEDFALKSIKFTK